MDGHLVVKSVLPCEFADFQRKVIFFIFFCIFLRSLRSGCDKVFVLWIWPCAKTSETHTEAQIWLPNDHYTKNISQCCLWQNQSKFYDGFKTFTKGTHISHYKPAKFTTIQRTISTEMTIPMHQKTNLPLNTKMELVKSIAAVYLWSFYLHFISLREHRRILSHPWPNLTAIFHILSQYSTAMYSVS